MMTISNLANEYAGKPVRPYVPQQPASGPCVYRLAVEYDSSHTFADLFDEFVTEHGRTTTTLIIGAWGDNMDGDGEHVRLLVSAKDRLPQLQSLYLGEMTYEECEMSWINHGDVSEIFSAFPKLTSFRLRGTTGLRLGQIKHTGIKSFALESGGLDGDNIAEVLNADLPNLEHLELWLGSSGYGAVDDLSILEPLFDGKLFPKLTSLALCNAELADDVASALASSAILPKLLKLDLSFGSLSDTGAEALLNSPHFATIPTFNLKHHYLSEAMAKRLTTYCQGAHLSDAQGECEDPSDRYILVGE